MAPWTPMAERKKWKALPRAGRAIMEALGAEGVATREAERVAAGAPLPRFQPGDVLEVALRASDGKGGGLKLRRRFRGLCIARRNRGFDSSFTLRNVIRGVGVERTFKIHSPQVEAIKFIRRKRVRRAKLYYLRDKPPRQSRV